MPAVSSFQKILLLSFFVLLFFPGGYLVANRFRFGQWGIDLGLTGAAERQELPAFTAAAWWSGHFQRDFLGWFGTYFGQKPRLVKHYNGFLYAAFRVSHMNGDTLRLGPRDWIFEDLYLRDFFDGEPPAPASALTERADAIARLHRACEQMGICFLLVISPNKAAFHPEEAPLWFQRKGVKIERDVDRFLRLLKERKIPVVDAHTRLVEKRKAGEPWPFFPRGGTHWNLWAASLVLQNILEQAEHFFQRPMARLVASHPRVDFTPEGTDTDLARLLNLPVPPTNYPAVKFDRRIETRPDTFLPRTFWVGDSFSRQLLQVAATDTQGVFATLDYGFYFDEFRRWSEPGLFIEAGARVPVPALRSAELIVLEMNEAAITRFDYSIRFANEAVRRLR